jgi:hypothetical protein
MCEALSSRPSTTKRERMNRHQWLMPVILASCKTEIRRIEVPGQPGEIVLEIPSPQEPEQNGLEVW